MIIGYNILYHLYLATEAKENGIFVNQHSKNQISRPKLCRVFNNHRRKNRNSSNESLESIH